MKGMKKREMIEMKVTKWNKRNESNKGDWRETKTKGNNKKVTKEAKEKWKRESKGTKKR
jgi:hypothetical protein